MNYSFLFTCCIFSVVSFWDPSSATLFVAAFVTVWMIIGVMSVLGKQHQCASPLFRVIWPHSYQVEVEIDIFPTSALVVLLCSCHKLSFSNKAMNKNMRIPIWHPEDMTPVTMGIIVRNHCLVPGDTRTVLWRDTIWVTRPSWMYLTR